MWRWKIYRIVGLDPGQTSGLTAFTIWNDEIVQIEFYELELVGVGGYLNERGYDYLAYEVANKFQVSGHVSSEVIGIAKYFASMANKEILPVNQSSWKRLITRDILKKTPLNIVRGVHARDAAGIGLFAAVNLRLISPKFLAQEET